MGSYFVTGTGTEVGKTYVTTGIIRASRQAGRIAVGVKPLMSGYDPRTPETSDAGALLAAMGKPITPGTISAISPWRYAAAMAPDQAASLEGRSVNLPALITFCQAAAEATTGLTLIEGVGGVMAPLDKWHTGRDWIAALHIPALLVAGTYLGTMSHILTAVEALQARHIDIAAIVLSESIKAPMSPRYTADVIAKFLPRIPIHTIARSQSSQDFQRLAWALDQIGPSRL